MNLIGSVAGRIRQRDGQSDTDYKTGIEEHLRQLSDVDLSRSKRYGETDIECSTFSQWPRYAASIKNPDEMRNALYYGFQPLYDALVENHVPPYGRELALETLGQIMSVSTDFLTGYYRGRPNVAGAREALSQVRLHNFDGTSYRTKFRNIDHYSDQATPQQILSLLQQFMEYALNGHVPDYLLGCACGSSEIVLAASGVMNLDAGFVRRSKRREDTTVKVITEHVDDIRSHAQGSSVYCIEDFVCTGQSIEKVMRYVKNQGATRVTGISLHRSGGYDFTRNLRQIVSDDDFNVFALK